MTRIRLDVNRCQGHGRCALEAPDAFDVDDIGKAVVLVGDVDGALLAEVRNAVHSCPEVAIAIED